MSNNKKIKDNYCGIEHNKFAEEIFGEGTVDEIASKQKRSAIQQGASLNGTAFGISCADPRRALQRVRD